MLMRSFFIAIFFIFLLQIKAQTRTVGLLEYSNKHSKMYYLFTPLNSKKTFLVDDCGNLVNSWTSAYTAGTSQVLLEDGSLIRSGLAPIPRFGLGSGGYIEKFDWDGNLQWTFKLADSLQCLHHDICIKPNGNILAIVWKYISPQDAINMGRKPSIAYPSVWDERIIEIQAFENDSFDIVWEWSASDHIIQNYDNTKPFYGTPADHPELLDINYVGPNPADWFHFNSIDFNAALNQIVLSAHSTDEILIIDNSTNMVQAAGHTGGTYGKGGDILYRWGNPEAYGRGVAEDRELFKQHHAHWVPNGKLHEGSIMIFNNGTNRTGAKFSSIDVIEPPQSTAGFYTLESGKAYKPLKPTIAYRSDPTTDFYAMNLSAAFSLDSGLFITSGPQGLFFETNYSGQIIWKYINPINGSGPIKQGTAPTGNNVFRCIPYKPNFAGFSGKDMSSKGPLETSPLTPSLCETVRTGEVKTKSAPFLYPNPAHNLISVKGMKPQEIIVRNAIGQVLMTAKNARHIDISMLNPGIYFLDAVLVSEVYRLNFVKD